jgi:NADH-dependent peroxiredoxin subunit F
MHELVIIGGGPAGAAAGIYASRKKIKTLLITESFGGQSIVSNDIQNWIGEKSITGLELAQKLEEHLRAQDGIEIAEGDLVTKIEKISCAETGFSHDCFRLTTREGKTYETKTVLIVSGSRRKKLGVPGEKELDGNGVVYCSTCDAPLFKDKTIAIVGGGNAGLESALDSIPYASKIYLVVRGEKVTILYNAVTQRILGEKSVTGLEYQDKKTGEMKQLQLDGVFVEIGAMPNTEFVKDAVQLNERGEVVVDHKTQAASQEGIWAAGDASDVFYKQNNISAGDAVKAILNIYEYLHKKTEREK